MNIWQHEINKYRFKGIFGIIISLLSIYGLGLLGVIFEPIYVKVYHTLN